MKEKLLLGSRVLFGLGFVIFGLNGFFQFMPNPPVTPEAGALLGAFAKTGYFFPMIKIIEIITGVLILFNFYAPLAAIVITPILVGITTIHLFLNPAGIPIMIFLHLLHGIIVYGYRKNYQDLLTIKAVAA
ncbi:DoxX family membrane protein [Bacteriovoracaceae bacterium]|nr:DoxX family membrane protein [Bacteriovoracaceae bacterium]